MRICHQKNKQRRIDPKQIWVSSAGNKFTVIVKVHEDHINADWTAYDFGHKKIASGPMKVTMTQSDAKDLNEKIKKYMDVILEIEQINKKAEVKNEAGPVSNPER